MPHVYFLGPQHIRLCTNTNVMPGSIWFHHAKQSPLVQHSTPSVPAHGKEELAHFICQGILRSIQKPLYNNQKTDLESPTPTLLPQASKQFYVASDAVFVESSTSNTLSSAPSALSNEHASIVINNEGRRREPLVIKAKLQIGMGLLSMGATLN